jgi:hypothetical protein
LACRFGAGDELRSDERPDQGIGGGNRLIGALTANLRLQPALRIAGRLVNFMAPSRLRVSIVIRLLLETPDTLRYINPA